MANMSKYFPIASEGKTCRDLFHNSETCFESFKRSVFQNYPGNFKMFFSYFVLWSIINRKKFTNTEYLKKNFLDIMGLSCYTYAKQMTMMLIICGFSHTFGKLYYLTTFCIPGFLSSLLYPSLTSQQYKIMTRLVYNQVVEMFIRNIDDKNLIFLKKSRIIGLLVFMSLSGYICEQTRNAKESLWIETVMERDENAMEKCSHKKTCVNYITTGFLSYSGVGLGLGVAKLLLKNIMYIKSPAKLIKEIDYNFVCCIPSYVLLFRIGNCYLRKQQSDMLIKNEKLFVGLISGISYLLFPNLQMISLGVTTAAQYWWRNVNESESEHVKRLLKLPIKRIVLAIGIGYMFHKSFFYPKNTTNLAAYMINNGTSGKLDKSRENVFKWVFGE